MTETRIVALLSVITLGLIVILISGILGQIYFNPLFWQVSGVGLILVSLRFLRQRGSRNPKEKSEELWEKQVNNLRNNGEKIVIDLRECKIRSGSFQKSKKELNYLDETSVFDILLSEPQPDESQSLEHSVLIYKHTLPNGKKKNFYGPTEKDKKTLLILCEMQISTSIYMDKNDPSIYYFDLEFLEK